MRFAFTEDQKLFRDSLRGLLDKECAPEVVRRAWNHDENGRSADLWSKLADLGVVGLVVPEAHGGLGLREIDSVLLFEECGRAALAEPIVETMGVGAQLLFELGDETRRSEWLPRIARGQARIAVGLGSSEFVTDAHVADLLLLQHEDELHALSPDQARLTEERSVDGARRLFRVAWTPTPATRVASGAVARTAMDRAFDRGALAVAAQLLGLSQKVLDITVEYVKVRKQFGVAIGTFQAVKHHLADALLKLQFARPVVYRAAHTMAHDLTAAPLHVSMAKVYASEAALVASRAALQCHGAIGYSFEHDLHLFMKRAWALAAAWGDGAFHRARVARVILGEDTRSPGGSR